MGFGEAITQLLKALQWQLPDEGTKRFVNQLYIAYYLLEHGYTEAAEFFVQFTEGEERVVVPDQYRFVVAAGMRIMEVNCHGAFVPIRIREVNCHSSVSVIRIEEVNCHNIESMGNKIIMEVNCH